jgi:hypothetical protein
MQIYNKAYLRSKLCCDSFHWWGRGFIQTYAQLWFHEHHSGNKETKFLYYASPLDPLRETNKVPLDGTIKYLVHVALNNGVSDGDHYAVMRFVITRKTIEILEGTRDFLVKSRRLRGYTFNRDALAVLRLCSLVGDDVTDVKSSGWFVNQGPSIYQQTDGWNCGPIA